jgi:energy-coupling factor transporter ATP-binding protein EcfA2
VNVLYGRNGAGKTQILEALSAASDWEMGPLEGFILQGATWIDEYPSDHRQADVPYSLQSMSASEVLDRFRNADSTLFNLGWTVGHHPSFLSGEYRERAQALISEFLGANTVMLTRRLRPRMMWGGEPIRKPDRQILTAPDVLELIPVLLPDAEAPLVRAHVRDLRDALRQSLAEAVATLGLTVVDDGVSEWACLDGLGRDFREVEGLEYQVEEAFREALSAWQQQWGWSPLLNARNFGYLGSGLDGHSSEYSTFAIHNSSSPIFLPPVTVADARGNSDFSGTELSPLFDAFQEGKRAGQTINLDQRRYRDWSRKSPSEVEVAAALRAKDDEVALLRSRLAFLPDLAGQLHADFHYESSDTWRLMKGSHRASEGSRAEVRWLEFALEANHDWVFLDEPEAGLHRTAEADLAQAITSPAWLSRVTNALEEEEGEGEARTIVVATHSPEFLALPQAHVLHVDGGRARPLTSIDRANLSALGLRPADLLSRVKTFLLVEGEHDRIVLDALIGDELRQLRVAIVVARGAKNMRDVFDSQVLFDFSDARLVALLDNIDARTVHNLWNRARDLAGVGQVDEAALMVRAELPRSDSGENRFLAQFLTRALQTGEHERVAAWGLSKADILFYLPPSPFGIKRTWEEALVDYREEDGNLKKWLTKKFNADFDSLETVRQASEEMDEIPEDFTQLLAGLQLIDGANGSK